MNKSEFAKLLETLARIAHATEALAKKADENFKTLAELNSTRPSESSPSFVTMAGNGKTCLSELLLLKAA
jgi:hypothetical protein